MKRCAQPKFGWALFQLMYRWYFYNRYWLLWWGGWLWPCIRGRWLCVPWVCLGLPTRSFPSRSWLFCNLVRKVFNLFDFGWGRQEECVIRVPEVEKSSGCNRHTTYHVSVIYTVNQFLIGVNHVRSWSIIGFLSTPCELRKRSQIPDHTFVTTGIEVE